MSDNEINTAGGEESIGGLPAADVKFLMTCLQNTTSGSISIDKGKVAEVLKFKNVNSVANKLSKLKLKYNLPIDSANNKTTPEKIMTGPRKAAGVADSNKPAIPKTPSKQRITKPRAPPSAKKQATSKTKKVMANEKDDDEEEGIKESPVDQEMEYKAAYEEAFAKSESEEDN